jgi:mannosyltransferase
MAEAGSLRAAAPAPDRPQAPARPRTADLSSRWPSWWPLVALTLLAAVLRLATLDLQSFWYDEAFTPVHVLHPGIAATWRSFVHTENTPPLWYLMVWAVSRVAGTGEVALRLPSALAGIATVPVAWGIGRELGGRRAAILAAAIVAVNPLLVWYSQEARAYGFFVLFVALAMLCCLRAAREPTPRWPALFALSGAGALLSHYFAVFLLAPMAMWLLWRCRVGPSVGRALPTDGHRPTAAPRRQRAALLACAALAAVGLALVPLALAQGGHGTQWIGAWALSSRVEAIPQYYLTGYSAAPLGHGVELLVALLILVGFGVALWRALTPAESDGALFALGVAACGVLLPLALAALGADYLAPRNLVAAMVPLSAGIAVIVVARRSGRTGIALGVLVVCAFVALSVDVYLSPRLQRGDWRGIAQVLRREWRARPARGQPTGSRLPVRVREVLIAGRRLAVPPQTAITTVELGAAPLEYYMGPLHNLPRDSYVRVREIDETGYAPLRADAGTAPAAGFQLLSRTDVHGLIVYRFLASAPRTVSEVALRTHVITAHVHPEVLVPGRGGASAGVP